MLGSLLEVTLAIKKLAALKNAKSPKPLHEQAYLKSS